jgi:hypothetical protein
MSGSALILDNFLDELPHPNQSLGQGDRLGAYFLTRGVDPPETDSWKTGLAARRSRLIEKRLEPLMRRLANP